MIVSVSFYLSINDNINIIVFWENLRDVARFVLYISPLLLISDFIRFRNYMIIVFDDRLEMFSIFGKKKVITWSDLTRIKVKKSYHGRITGTMIILTFYTGDGFYEFNINSLDKKKVFFQGLMKKCISQSIEVIDLTSDEMKFFSRIEERLWNFILKLLKKLK